MRIIEKLMFGVMSALEQIKNNSYNYSLILQSVKKILLEQHICSIVLCIKFKAIIHLYPLAIRIDSKSENNSYMLRYFRFIKLFSLTILYNVHSKLKYFPIKILSHFFLIIYLVSIPSNKYTHLCIYKQSKEFVFIQNAFICLMAL